MKKQLIQFWRSRAPRERVVLAGGSALLVLALGIAYGWLPIQRDAAQLRTALPQLRAQALQLQQDAAEATHLKARPAVSQGGSLATIIEQRATAGGLREQIESITPQDAGRVRVVLPEVAFDVWIGWLGELQASHGVRVESARIDAGEEPGMVKVEAVLAGG
jgi:general secretion pathway protein M